MGILRKKFLIEKSDSEIFKTANYGKCICIHVYNSYAHVHAGHTRKASRISEAAVDNCGKGLVTFICHSKRFV